MLAKTRSPSVAIAAPSLSDAAGFGMVNAIACCQPTSVTKRKLCTRPESAAVPLSAPGEDTKTRLPEPSDAGRTATALPNWSPPRVSGVGTSCVPRIPTGFR
jgi:hypothetical protein